MSKTSKDIVLVQNSITKNKSLEEKFQKAKTKILGFDDFLHEFLNSFVSKQTRSSYMKDLQMFFEFIHSGGDKIISPEDIKSYHFSLYRDWMIEQNYAPATINRRLVCIRSFMKWSLSQGLISINPLDAIKLPKVQTVTPTQAFTDDEAKRMIASPNIAEFQGSTHRIVLILLFYLGLRRAEITKIRWKDITKERHHTVIKVITKGAKIRFVPIPPTVMNELEEYKARLENFYKSKVKDTEFIIQTSKKSLSEKPMDGSTVYRIVSRYAKRLGINKKVGAHSCRATVISHLLDTQKSTMREVADFAGHEQITTTQRYDKKRKGLDENPVYKIDFEKKTG